MDLEWRPLPAAPLLGIIEGWGAIDHQHRTYVVGRVDDNGRWSASWKEIGRKVTMLDSTFDTRGDAERALEIIAHKNLARKPQ